MPDCPSVRVAVTVEQCWHDVPGGTARATLDTAAAVAAHGGVEQVGVAAWHRQPPRAGFEPPIPVRHLPLPRTALYEAWHALRRPRIERTTGPIDLIHATAYVLPPASVPIVATVHDLHFLHEPSHFTRRGVRVFGRFLDLVRDEAAAVLCPSDDTRDDCVDAGIAVERIHVVPWGISVQPVSEQEIVAVREQHGLTQPYILFVGTIEPRKNLARLLDAVQRLHRDDVELVVVGPQGWNEQLRPPPNTRRLGFVPARERDALYAGAAVVAYPSLREGFGLPVLEALAQGAPVVTSLGTATAEVAGDAAVLVDPREVDDIAAGIQRVLDDSALSTRLREAGPRRAAAHTWERTAAGTVAAYTAALGGTA